MMIILKSIEERINQSGSYENYKPLLTAKEELVEIKRLEDAGSPYVPETYNRYSQMKSQLDSKGNDIGKQYNDYANEWNEANPQMAKKYYDIANQLMYSAKWLKQRIEIQNN